MFKSYFNGIDGIASYPMLLLIVFFVFFAATMVYLWKADNSHMEYMREMPIKESENATVESSSVN